MKIRLFCLIVILAVLSGCAQDKMEVSYYTGKQLTIGVVGEPPIQKGHTVIYEKITFEELKNIEYLSDFDAVFITKDNLLQAANKEFKSVYKTASIPFFFIQSTKSHIPFTHEELSYETVPDLSPDMYATGYFKNRDEFLTWGYGLHNNEENQTNIEDVYTRIFQTIASIDKERNEHEEPI
ncbi:hypothetical protein KQJ23_09605 [Paenibacillus sp. MSJ-6]|uniref:Lipoprotein n=1 Tax=Paenibacillus brevis TaxID=2841508 RepID=A0ABS6FSF2_9BACL|nr:hypothetical protein [Paenibacillus brevis]